MTLKLIKFVFRAMGVIVLILLVTVGGWIAYSYFVIDHDMQLPAPFEVEQGNIDTAAGRVSYFADRNVVGRPLVLVHSLNAAASSYEMKPLFELYRGERPIYALDLPGFGLSERRDQRYTPQLYSDVIEIFLQEVVGEPADVVALSLGSEFAAMTAVQAPDSVHTLVLLSPTGLSPIPDVDDSVYNTLSNPLWGRPLFDLLVTRPSLNLFLGQTFYGDIPEDYIDYAYLTGHQPGAHHAPLYFVSGQLFTPDVRTSTYENLTMPTLIIYGDDPNVSFDNLPALLDANPNVTAVRQEEMRALPHWDRPEATAVALAEFWAD